jgi:hypothetical protein
MTHRPHKHSFSLDVQEAHGNSGRHFISLQPSVARTQSRPPSSSFSSFFVFLSLSCSPYLHQHVDHAMNNKHLNYHNDLGARGLDFLLVGQQMRREGGAETGGEWKSESAITQGMVGQE